jgi:hypothetical protein
VLLVGLAVTRWHQCLDLQADQLVQIVAAQGSELPVGEDDPAVRIGDQDPSGRASANACPASPACTAIAAGPLAGFQASRSYAALRARNTTLPGTAASEPASYGSWAQRTIRTGRRA